MKILTTLPAFSYFNKEDPWVGVHNGLCSSEKADSVLRLHTFFSLQSWKKGFFSRLLVAAFTILRSKFFLHNFKWTILVSKEVWVTIFINIIIFKCRPSWWVAMLLFGSISHTLHFSYMVLEFFLHHIQYNITIPITPWPSPFKENQKKKKKKPQFRRVIS